MTQSFHQLRRIEQILIFTTTAIFVIRHLFEEAGWFDEMVTRAEESIAYLLQNPHLIHNFPKSIKLHSIWKDLASYNHQLNTNLPIILGTTLFLAAWYVFHFYAYPAIRAGKKDLSALLLCMSAIGLTFSSVLIYDLLKLYIRFRYDYNQENIIGLKVYSLYRKLNVAGGTFTFFAVIMLYEYVAQGVYYIFDKAQKKTVSVFTFYLPVAILGFLIFLFGIFGNFPDGFFDFRYSFLIDRASVFYGLVLLSIYQQIVYKDILPYRKNIFTTDFQRNIIFYLFLVFAGSLCLMSPSHYYFYRFSRFYRLFQPTVFLFIIFVTASFVVSFIRYLLDSQKIQLQTQVSQKSAELSLLRSQINPHFLFNALNTLFAVALKENAEKTSEGIQKLGDMMRFMLHENHQDRIPLSKEIEYLHNLIAIQKMRLDESQAIEIRINIQQPEKEIFIAPMLLNPFVENAFKHGISFRNESWIFITLTLDAKKLYFKVHNSLHSKPENDPEAHQSGVGLENVKKRLKLIYPNQHELTIQQSEQDYFIALTIEI
jgi:sensor histidine kinase YesM